MYPPYGSSQFLLKHKDIRLSYNYFTLQKISLFCCLGCDFTKNPSNSIINFGIGEFNNWLEGRIVFHTLHKRPKAAFHGTCGGIYVLHDYVHILKKWLEF